MPCESPHWDPGLKAEREDMIDLSNRARTKLEAQDLTIPRETALPP